MIISRTPYIQSILRETLSKIHSTALGQKKIDGAWEKALSERIHEDYLNDHPEVTEIIESVKEPGEVASKTYLKAAYLITSSIINPEDDLQGIRFGQ